MKPEMMSDLIEAIGDPSDTRPLTKLIDRFERALSVTGPVFWKWRRYALTDKGKAAVFFGRLPWEELPPADAREAFRVPVPEGV